MYLYQIFSSYVYAFAYRVNERKSNYNSETDFVFTQFMNLPWYFRLVFGILVILTNLVLRKGFVPFYKLSLEDRILKIEFLERINFPILKDFLKFYRSLTVFAYYSFIGGKNV